MAQSVQTGAFTLPALTAEACTPLSYAGRIPAWHFVQVSTMLSRCTRLAASLLVRISCAP